MRRWRGALGVLATLAITTSACTSSASVSPTAVARSTNGIPYLAAATAGPGTKLLNGFVVEPGTRLVGAVFPQLGGDALVDHYPGVLNTEDGWSAQLILDGDPATVARAYVQAAEKLGLDDGKPSGQCMPNLDPHPPDQHAEPGVLRVALTGGTAPHRRVFAVSIFRGASGAEGAANQTNVAFVNLQYYAETDWRAVLQAKGLTAPDDLYIARGTTNEPANLKCKLTIVDSGLTPTLLGAGQPIAHEVNHGNLSFGITVLAGSRLVVPPTPTNTCTIGLDAVFAISGDPSAVMQAYNVRFGFNPQTKPTEMSSPYGRALVLTSEAPDQIGNLLYLIGATRDGHNYLSVRTCPDS